MNADGEGSLLVRTIGREPYEPIWQKMREFTDSRDTHTLDELWLVEHEPVFTLGQAGKPEHILLEHPSIPTVKTDRGGQVTYHGPGQLVAYPLIDIKRNKMGVRELVTRIEVSVVKLLLEYGVEAAARPDAPGVYIGAQKIASLGLRIRRGCSFHGVAINLSMDLAPFAYINPCGYAGMEMAQLMDVISSDRLPSFESFQQKYAMILAAELGYSEHAVRFLSA